MPSEHLRGRLGGVVARHHKAGMLAGAEIDDIIAVLREEGQRVTWCEKCDQYFNSSIWKCPFFECQGDPIKGRWVPWPEEAS